MDPTIIVAIIGVLGIIIQHFLNKANNKKLVKQNSDLEKDNLDLKNEVRAYTLLYDQEFITIINKSIDNIFSQTKADRFLLLFAVNGKSNFSHVTACLERRQNLLDSKTSTLYQRLVVDEAYKMMLNYIEYSHDNKMNFATNKMANVLLKRIYSLKTENVKHSNVYFIKRINIDNDNDLLLFCSVATDIEDAYTTDEHLIIDANINNVRSKSDNLKVNIE